MKKSTIIVLRTIVVILLVLIIVQVYRLVNATGSGVGDSALEETKTYLVDKAPMSIEKFLEEYDNDKFRTSMVVEEEDENEVVYVTVTERQRKNWITEADETIRIMEETNEDRYVMSLSEDKTMVIIELGKGELTMDCSARIALYIWCSELYQIFTDAEQWDCTVRVIDKGTGKMVYEKNFRDGLSISDSMFSE